MDFIVWNTDGVPTKPQTYRTALNSNTDVTILAAPGTNGQVKEPVGVSIFNKDTANVTVTVKTDDGTTERIIIKRTIGADETLHYMKGIGWYREAVV